MKILINVILVVVIGVLGYLLYDSIREPIVFKAAKDKRSTAVIQKLIKIRKAQDLYRGITSAYAPNFDTLAHVLKTGEFKIVSVYGDRDVAGATITYDTIIKRAIDSVRVELPNVNLDSLKYIPYGNGEIFSIAADTLAEENSSVNVVEVSTTWKKFMGIYGSDRFSRYDDRYSPSNLIKFGDMTKPNTGGNWE